MNYPFKGSRAVDARERIIQCVFRRLPVPCPFRAIPASGLAGGYDCQYTFVHFICRYAGGFVSGQGFAPAQSLHPGGAFVRAGL